MMDYDIDKLVGEMDFSANHLNNVGKVLLTNKEIEVLDRYNIEYKKCGSLKEIIFEIEEILNDDSFDCDDLELVSESISERDYYQNTNK